MCKEARLKHLWDIASGHDLPAWWIKREALAGRLPCLRVGRRLLFDPAAVERALIERAGRPPDIVEGDEPEVGDE